MSDETCFWIAGAVELREVKALDKTNRKPCCSRPVLKLKNG